MEKLKENKKLLIGVIAAAVVVAIVLVVFLSSVVFKPSYKSQIKKWAKVCDDKDKLEKYVKKNANLRALYATKEMMKDIDFSEYMGMDEDEASKKLNKEFEKEYKKAKKSDYKDDDIIDLAVDSFYYKDFEKVKITDIGKLKNVDEDDGIKGSKECKIKAEVDGDKYTGKATFYKGKIVSISLTEKDDD